MRVLVVGSGGREHALVWKIGQSPLVTELFCAPGNAGIARLASCVAIEPADVQGLGEFAATRRIDLTVVGPELPLTLGILDQFTARGLALFGASREAAEIEASKAFSKQFMTRHGIPTARYEVFSSSAAASAFLESAVARFPLVVKADGLAAGKGVVICKDRAEAIAAVSGIMDARVHGLAGARVVLEEFLEGREASYFVLTDGSRIQRLATCQDYKRAGDGDTGLNTGGMGAYSPSVFVDEQMSLEIDTTIVAPTVAGLANEGRPYRGVLYVGLMLTASGPKVLEYNARFGDPETQVLLPRMTTDIVPLFASAASGQLDPSPIVWRPESAVTVVLAAGGYPGSIRKGMPIHGIEAAEALEDVTVFLAGASGSAAGAGGGNTLASCGGAPVVSGGRVLAVTALGKSLEAAASRAYEGAARVRFDGAYYRRDIARDAISELAAGLAGGDQARSG